MPETATRAIELPRRRSLVIEGDRHPAAKDIELQLDNAGLPFEQPAQRQHLFRAIQLSHAKLCQPPHVVDVLSLWSV